MYIPETVEDKEELNEDAAKWQYASHEGGGDRMRQPALVRNLTRNLVCSHRLLRCLLREGGERRIKELVAVMEGEEEHCTVMISCCAIMKSLLCISQRYTLLNARL